MAALQNDATDAAAVDTKPLAILVCYFQIKDIQNLINLNFKIDFTQFKNSVQLSNDFNKLIENKLKITKNDTKIYVKIESKLYKLIAD